MADGAGEADVGERLDELDKGGLRLGSLCGRVSWRTRWKDGSEADLPLGGIL